MKKFAMIFAVATVALLAACGAGKSGGSKAWVGTWEADFGGLKAEATFNADGTAVYVLNGTEMKGLGWLVKEGTDANGDKVTIVYGTLNADGTGFKDSMGEFVYDKAAKTLTGKGDIVWTKK
jgi:hypothetical protein